MSIGIITVAIRQEPDIVTVRQRAREIADGLGFHHQDRTRIATAVSEIARNAYRYAGGGKAEFRLEGEMSPQLLIITITDNGPGIADLRSVLEGRYTSPTGMGMGIVGARRLMDQCDIRTEKGKGTTVVLKKMLSRGAPVASPQSILKLVDSMNAGPPRSSLDELQSQNQELLRTLDELRRRQEELVRVNGELEDTNRGVLSLYAELDERADHLRRADVLKTKFLSNMSHEFRSPLNSIQALSSLLLNRTDGPLNEEQALQVGYIKKAAADLTELVNDLLDLAKVEAGKVEVKPADFDVEDLFGALRGMLRPLLLDSSVQLIFEDTGDIGSIYSDEGKISQILRNFISNALKFTEQGEIRVSAQVAGSIVRFSVKDTGIGIAPEDFGRIFEDFTQVENPLQRKVKGTGLGLPLSKKLAGLLGGEILVESKPLEGSTFILQIPAKLQSIIETSSPSPTAEESAGSPVLVVENRSETVLLYRKWLRDTPFRIVHVSSTREAERAIAIERPAAIILDILLDGEDSWGLLASLKNHDETRGIPIIVCSTTDDRRKALHLGADAYLVKPTSAENLLDALYQLSSGNNPIRVLIIDDNERDRYVLKRRLRDGRVQILEARDGADGVAKARTFRPELIFLDLAMPEMSGFEVLEALKSDPHTEAIQVVVHTSAPLTDADRKRLLERASILRKDEWPQTDSIGFLVSRLGDAGRRLAGSGQADIIGAR